MKPGPGHVSPTVSFAVSMEKWSLEVTGVSDKGLRVPEPQGLAPMLGHLEMTIQRYTQTISGIESLKKYYP